MGCLGFTSPAELRDYLACVVRLCPDILAIALTLEAASKDRTGALRYVHEGQSSQYGFCVLTVALNVAKGLYHRHTETDSRALDITSCN